MYEIENNPGSSKAVLHLSGDLTVQNSSEIKEKLAGLIKQNSIIEINQQNIDSIDLSYLQLLIAAIKSADSAGKKISIVGVENGLFYESLKDMGYNVILRAVDNNFQLNSSGVQNG